VKGNVTIFTLKIGIIKYLLFSFSFSIIVKIRYSILVPMKKKKSKILVISIGFFTEEKTTTGFAYPSIIKNSINRKIT